MKKSIAFLLAVTLCLSLAVAGFAAGEEAPEEEAIEITAENWSEYFVLAPEYEGKVTGYEIEEVRGSVTLKAAPNMEDAVEVPITLENWTSFFEIAPEQIEEKNSFGELESLHGGYHVYLREEFKDALVPSEDSCVAFAFSFDSVLHSVSIQNEDGTWTSYGDAATTRENLANGSAYTINEYADSSAGDALFEADQPGGALISNFPVFIKELFPIAESDEDGMLTTQECTNFQATRVEGSIFLAGIDPEVLEAAMHPPKEYDELSVGGSGDAVAALQQALIDQGFLSGVADGYYGDGTAAAVAAFQGSVGLEATGTADSETQRALFGD